MQEREGAQSLLEEISECRAENIGVSGFAECLDPGPKVCPYALPFGYAFLCQHPRYKEIVEQTHAERVSHPAQA